MQFHQHPRRLRRRGLAPDVLARKLLEAELARATAFPQEIRFEPPGEALRLVEEHSGLGPLKGKQYAGGLDFRPAAVRTPDVERRRRALEHGAGFQLAIFLIEKVHAKTRVCVRDVAENSAGCDPRRGSPPARLPRSARPPADSRAPRRRFQLSTSSGQA